MTNTGLASPPQPRTSLERPAAPPPVPERPPLSIGRKPPRLDSRSVALSIFVHLLLLLVFIFFARFGPPEPIYPPSSAPSGGTSFEIILDFPSGAPGELAPITAPPAVPANPGSSLPVVVIPPLPRAQAGPQQSAPTVARPNATSRPGAGGSGTVPGATRGTAGGGGTGPAAGSGGAATSGTSTRDALRPGYRDPRLYAPIDEFPELRKTDEERYTERLQARIDAVNDSMGFESNRDRTTSDWTLTDSDGDRWGLSPDGLHLGGITIPREVLPLPRATGDNQSLEAERERRRMREEIERQEADRERAETERERIEAMRRSGGGQ